jgi:glutaredoxin
MLWQRWAARLLVMGAGVRALACGGDPKLPPVPPPRPAVVAEPSAEAGPVTVADSPPIEASAEGSAADARTAMPAPDALRVELYMMSKCPFAAKVVPDVEALARALGPRARIVVDYIGTVGERGELTSMHGPSEVDADLAQVCAARVAPERLLAMMSCQTRAGFAQAESSAGPCAAEAGISLALLKACIASGEGERLLAASFERSRARGARGSPSIFIGGEQHVGRRTAAAFLRKACAMLAPPPAACLRLPPSPEVKVVLLSDRRCADCDAQSLQSLLESRFERPVVRELDYGEPEGRRLFAATGAASLPIAVFDESLAADAEGFEAVQPMLKGSAPSRYLAGSIGWNPACHDPGGCARRECRGELTCRPEMARRLDLFVMSQCPYAAHAMRALPELLGRLGPSVDLRIHYIGTGNARAGFGSLHGASEVDEDIRQLCAAKLFPGRRAYLDYLGCRAADPRSFAWESCATAASGIDPRAIARCSASAEGPRLLGRSFAFSTELGISGSPTWLVNNRYRHVGTEAAAIEQAFCAHNRALASCKLLAPTTAEPRPSPAPAPAPVPVGSGAGCQANADPGSGQCR